MTDKTAPASEVEQRHDYPDQEVLDLLRKACDGLRPFLGDYSNQTDKEFPDEDERAALDTAHNLVHRNHNYHLRKRREWWANRMRRFREACLE